ncbi:MAG: hypothetical protein R3B99_08240 [Polyangiales bacterium]
MSDEALAMLAGYTDSAAFGFLPTENNGFDLAPRPGLPSTSTCRVCAPSSTVTTRRGLTITRRGAAAFRPLLPMVLIEFEPEACDDGIGLDAEGTLHWTGGNARYLSVLEADAQAPGVPPNFDLPEGTLWSIAGLAQRRPSRAAFTTGRCPRGCRSVKAGRRSGADAAERTIVLPLRAA